ncbi:MAG: class II aldolase/adducin family protein [Planctomycetota bacterium]
MADQPTRLESLIHLSRWLGEPARDCVMLGEGNTSTRLGDESFLVKASGVELARVEAAGFLEVGFAAALSLLSEELDDKAVKRGLNEAKVDPDSPLRPSVETALHAVCLSLPGVEFVGHSHPTAVNAITCSKDFEAIAQQCLFPDQIVVCGAYPLLVPYVDPGVPLARELQGRLAQHVEQHGRPPKSIYLQNHGFIALGASVKQVQAITLMAVKAARIAAGAIACGGIHPMSEADVRRIDGRDDEHYRQRVIESSSTA